MRTCTAVGLALLLLPGIVRAQNQSPVGGGTAPYAPNYYNRNSQPLSPYLNLMRGGNPAVNYFYGVRPGLMTGAFGAPSGGGNNAAYRQTFFPQVDTLYDFENVGPQDGMRPTGHPMGFSNTLGYFVGPPGLGSGGGGGQRNANQSPLANRRSMMGGR